MHWRSAADSGIPTGSGEAIDLTKWLERREAGGADQRSKVGDPEFLSVDFDSRDLLMPQSGNPQSRIRAQAVVRADGP